MADLKSAAFGRVGSNPTPGTKEVAVTDDRPDAYRRAAVTYDLVIEPFLRTTRLVGLEMLPPKPGMRVLDVGCGTGAQLERYRDAGCAIACVDMSPGMLAQVARRLGDVDARKTDGTTLPFEDDLFDLATISFVLHEVAPEKRLQIINEMARVVRPAGHLLVADFVPGPWTMKGRLYRPFIMAVEFAAGRDHFRHHRDFLRSGGVPGLVSRADLEVTDERFVGGGTIGVYLVATP